MKDILADVWLHGYQKGAVAVICQQVIQDQLVLHQTQAEAMQEHYWTFPVDRIP